MVFGFGSNPLGFDRGGCTDVGIPGPRIPSPINIPSGGPSTGITSGGCTPTIPIPRPIPDILSGGNSKEERLERRIRELERALSKCQDDLKEAINSSDMYKRWYYEERDARREDKEKFESNERMIRSLQGNIDDNQRRHETEMARAKKETEERIEKLECQQLKSLEKMSSDHENEMAKATEAHSEALAKLDEKLEKTKAEGLKQLARQEEHNELIQQKHMEERKMAEYMMEKITKQHEGEKASAKQRELELLEEVANEKQKLAQLEQQYQFEMTEKLNEELNQKIALSATQEVMKEFLKITKTVKDMGESLGYIQSCCSSDLSELESNVEVNLREMLSSRSKFKEDVYRFEQLLINEQNIQQEILRACKDYAHTFENFMDNEKFMNLCVHLPSAIEHKDQAKIEKFAKLAGDLSTELKDERDEIEKKLDKISSGNLQKRLE